MQRIGTTINYDPNRCDFRDCIGNQTVIFERKEIGEFGQLIFSSLLSCIADCMTCWSLLYFPSEPLKSANLLCNMYTEPSLNRHGESTLGKVQTCHGTRSGPSLAEALSHLLDLAHQIAGWFRYSLESSLNSLITNRKIEGPLKFHVWKMKGAFRQEK